MRIVQTGMALLGRRCAVGGPKRRPAASYVQLDRFWQM